MADEYSDIDLCVIVADDSYTEVLAGREALVRGLGDPLFLEDFGRDDNMFAILTDGTELELIFFRESELHSIRSGPFRVLLDKEGILEGPSSLSRSPTVRHRSRSSDGSLPGSGTTSRTSPRRSDGASSGGRRVNWSSSATIA